jgi:predicted SnoaL-like aldol condensation-catalyzing enzyme
MSENRRMTAMNDQLEQNKKRAIAFYELMFNQGQPAEAIERYVGDTYIQPSPKEARQ